MSGAERETRGDADQAARRRGRLGPGANPDQAIDYMVRLAGRLTAETTLTVCYVPDKRIVTRAAFERYLAALGNQDWPAPEALAVATLGVFNKELVPRWVSVIVERDRHQVVVEDRQPGWQNPALLARLTAV